MKTKKAAKQMTQEQEAELESYRRAYRINFDARRYYDEMVRGAATDNRRIEPGEPEGFAHTAQMLAEEKEVHLPEPKRPAFLGPIFTRRSCP